MEKTLLPVRLTFLEPRELCLLGSAAGADSGVSAAAGAASAAGASSFAFFFFFFSLSACGCKQMLIFCFSRHFGIKCDV
jgi:hypothetical protein